MIPPPFVLYTEKRQNRSLIQDVTPFLNNIIFQSTNPLPFETEPHTLHTIPLAREHCDSYLHYIRYKTLEITSSQTPFQVIFNPVKGISTGTYYRTIHPQNVTFYTRCFPHVHAKTYWIQWKPRYTTLLFFSLRRSETQIWIFRVPDLETRVQRLDHPHYWLQQDILQVKNFQHRFFYNITLTNDTIHQVKVFT